LVCTCEFCYIACHNLRVANLDIADGVVVTGMREIDNQRLSSALCGLCLNFSFC
jgi:hypothetical protein